MKHVRTKFLQRKSGAQARAASHATAAHARQVWLVLLALFAFSLQATAEQPRRLPPVYLETWQTINSPLPEVGGWAESVSLDSTSWTGSRAPEPLNLFDCDVETGMAATIELDMLHDFNALGLRPDVPVLKEFITASIPVGGEAARRDNRTGFSPNQTNLEAWAHTETELGRLVGYTKMNITRSSTLTEFQIYKAYGELGWLKAGFDYTLWLNQAASPSTLDFEGPNAVPFIIFPQISIKVPLEGIGLSPDCFFVFGLEDAPADVTLPRLTIPDANTVNRIPSIIAKWIYEPEHMHVEVGGMVRHVTAQGTGYRSDVDGWGLTASGRFDGRGKDNFIIAGQVGKMIGAYSQDTLGLQLDAAPRSATDPNLRGIQGGGGWVAYKHWWTENIRSSATYGYWFLDTNFDVRPNPVGTFLQTNYSSINLIWSPVPSVDMGVECIYGNRKVNVNTAVDGSRFGENHRIQATVRWNFGAGSPAPVYRSPPPP